MSTEINIRVDRALLLQRDQQQRQAQRQFVLEKNGQRLVVNQGQAAAAQSGGRGGENRIVTSTRSAATTAALPKVPVTAGYQRKPLPDLSIGAATASQGADAGSYLLLPKPYVDLSFPHYGGKPLTGYEVTTVGYGLKPLYSVNSSANSFRNYYGNEDVADEYLQLFNPQRLFDTVGPDAYRPAVVDGDWTIAGPYFTSPGLTNPGVGSNIDDRIGIYYRLLDFGRSSDFASPAGPYTYPELTSEEFTFEYLVRPGSAKLINYKGQLLMTWMVTWFGTFMTSVYLGDTLDYFLGINEMYFFLKPTSRTRITSTVWYQDSSYYNNPTWLASNSAAQLSGQFDVDEVVPDALFSQFVHVAIVFSKGTFSIYLNGSRKRSASAATLGWPGQVQPTAASGYAPYMCISSLGQHTGPLEYLFSSDLNEQPLLKPAIKGIRFTANRALYTGDSFSPPTFLTRLV